MMYCSWSAQGEPEQVVYGQPQGEPRQGYDVGVLRSAPRGTQTPSSVALREGKAIDMVHPRSS